MARWCVARGRGSAIASALGRLHVLTDAREGRRPLEVVAAALSAGAGAGGQVVVQVRAKGVDDRAYFDFAARVADACARAGALCIVNDRPDVALAVGAGGTHLGADDLPLHAVRRVVGAGHVVGGTTRDPAGARALAAEGADYLGVGPVNVTTTKDGLPDPLGPEGVAAVAAAVDVPVIAIGAVTAEHVPALLAAGAHGVAVVGAVSDAADPAAAVRALLELLR